MSTPNDPTSSTPPVDPTQVTVTTPAVDPTTGYRVPPTTPDAVPAAPAGTPTAWFRQPWGVAALVLAGVFALGLSFVAGFATRSALDRAFVRGDLISERLDQGQGGLGQRGPGMGPGGMGPGAGMPRGDRDGDGYGYGYGYGDRDGYGGPGGGPAAPAPQATPTPSPTVSG